MEWTMASAVLYEGFNEKGMWKIRVPVNSGQGQGLRCLGRGKVIGRSVRGHERIIVDTAGELIITDLLRTKPSRV